MKRRLIRDLAGLFCAVVAIGILVAAHAADEKPAEKPSVKPSGEVSALEKVTAERDKLKAENEALKKDIDRIVKQAQGLLSTVKEQAGQIALLQIELQRRDEESKKSAN